MFYCNGKNRGSKFASRESVLTSFWSLIV